MKTEIIIAGHGGQGVLDLANYIAYYELLKGRHVAYTPSYGPETRGGKVKCYVIVSDQAIDSPIVENPDLLIAMNQPSMDFVPLLKRGGLLVMNSTLISSKTSRPDIKTIEVPATEIAFGLRDLDISHQIADTKIAGNAVVLGAYLSLSNEDLDREVIKETFSHFLQGRKSRYIPLNLEAVRRGYDFVRQNPKVILATIKANS